MVYFLTLVVALIQFLIYAGGVIPPEHMIVLLLVNLLVALCCLAAELSGKSLTNKSK